MASSGSNSSATSRSEVSGSSRASGTSTEALAFFYFPTHPNLRRANSAVIPPPADALVNDTFEKVKTVIPEIDRQSVKSALRNDFSQNDPARAKFLLEQYRDALAGMVVSISKQAQRKKLQGASNMNGISCYVDSLLFSMFSRMENFEPLLYQHFDDMKRALLSTWLRLFVNLIRLGELVTKDIVHGLLATCVTAGWGFDRPGGQAINNQQDAAEFFAFLTDALKMPKLTLRVEIAHAGRENAEDDHKVVTEQLLYLPVPGTKDDPPLLLEECLEMYFANSINVNRRVAARSDSADMGTRQRSYSIVSTHTLSTLNHPTPSMATPRRGLGFSENPLDDSDATPFTPPTDGFSSPQLGTHSPGFDSPLPSYSQLFGDVPQREDVKRKMWTSNNEITFPAWMFLQLMPFYTDVRDSSALENLEAQQVAQHFSETRPVLGLCLKRYFWGPNGEPHRNDRHIIVPETIFLPSFVADDSDRDRAFGNFKLELESAIFHRGNSIHSGHYLALVCDICDSKAPEDLKRSFSWRSRSKSRRHRAREDAPKLTKRKRWLFFDDLAPVGEKVIEVDFQQTMAELCPYMLFYRMVALDPEEIEEQPAPKLPERPTLHHQPLVHAVSHDSSLDPLEEEPSVSVPRPPKSSGDSIGGLPNILEAAHISDSSPEMVPLHPTISPDPLRRSLELDYADREDVPRRRRRFLRRSHKDYAASYREEKCTIM